MELHVIFNKRLHGDFKKRKFEIRFDIWFRFSFQVIPSNTESERLAIGGVVGPSQSRSVSHIHRALCRVNTEYRSGADGDIAMTLAFLIL